jgi:hypothetical protein
MANKAIFNEPTTVIGKRVPASKKQEISIKFDAVLDDYKLIQKIQSETLDKCADEADKTYKNNPK